MGGPQVTEGSPSVVHIRVGQGPDDVRRELAGFSVRQAGSITGIDCSGAAALVERFYGAPAFPVAPLVVEVPQRAITEATGRDARGGYIQGTNMIMISERAMKPVFRSAEQGQRTMVHELLHYQSFLGSGHEMSYGSARREMPDWFSEGITQSFAELIMPSAEAPTYSYAYEVLAAVLLERLAGVETLKAAFMTGNFSAVREAVDGRLGERTFEQFLGHNDGGSAYLFLYGTVFAMRAGEPPFSEEGFLSDLRVRGAMKSIDLLESPAFRRLADEAKELNERDTPEARRRLRTVAGEIMERERLSG